VGVHSITFSYIHGNMKCDFLAHSWPTPLQAFILVTSLRLGLRHNVSFWKFQPMCLEEMWRRISWNMVDFHGLKEARSWKFQYSHWTWWQGPNKITKTSRTSQRYFTMFLFKVKVSDGLLYKFMDIMCIISTLVIYVLKCCPSCFTTFNCLGFKSIWKVVSCNWNP